MSNVYIAEFDVPDDGDLIGPEGPAIARAPTLVFEDADGNEVCSVPASVTWSEDRDGGALGEKGAGISSHDLVRARVRSFSRMSHIMRPKVRPTCRILGKPLDKHLVAQEVVRALAMVGLTAEAGRFGSWANDKDVSLDDVLAEADRLCQVC